MNLSTALLFSATVFPLICTPGPDMLFIASQAIAGNRWAGLRATAGVCAGYVIHSLLVALGLAAIIAASPILFAALRWFGVAYLIWLAVQLIRSALKPRVAATQSVPSTTQFKRGFLTALLNPKGMMVYFALLPQFMREGESAALQAMILSAIFIGLCAAVYTVLCVMLTTSRKAARFDDRRRRWVDGASGGLLVIAAGWLAST